MIKYANLSDLPKISECHITAFPDSVTSLLGEKVVASMLKWYLSAPNKFLFYIDQSDMVIGYCGGFIIDGTDAYGSGSGMTQFGFKQALSAFLLRPWLLFHPEVRNKYGFIFTNVKRKFGLLKEQKPQQVILPEENKSSTLTAGLVVIGVRPNLQQKGLGTILQQEFEAKARSMGAKRLQLSVRKTNQQAIKSYQRNGYTIHHELGPSFVMIKELQ